MLVTEVDAGLQPGLAYGVTATAVCARSLCLNPVQWVEESIREG